MAQPRRSFSHPLESRSSPDIPRPTAWEFLESFLVRWWEKDRPRGWVIERLVARGSRSPGPPRIMKARGLPRAALAGHGPAWREGAGAPFPITGVVGLLCPTTEAEVLGPEGPGPITGGSASSRPDY